MRIALFYNTPAGGSKRAIYEHARHLRERGHILDLYILPDAVEDYLPLRGICENIYRYDVPAVSRGMAGEWDRLTTGLLRRTVGERRSEFYAEYRRMRRHGRELQLLQRVNQ